MTTKANAAMPQRPAVVEGSGMAARLVNVMPPRFRVYKVKSVDSPSVNSMVTR